MVDNVYAYVVQYNGRYDITIDTICDIMVNESDGNKNDLIIKNTDLYFIALIGSTALQRLAEVHTLVLNFLEENCTDYKYDNLITDWKNTTIVSSSMSECL